MEQGFNLPVMARSKLVVEGIHVHIVGNLQVDEVAEFVTLLEVIHGNDVGALLGQPDRV